MVRLFVFLAAVQLVLVVLALIGSLSADRVRTMPRFLWILAILLIPLLGPVAYFLWGRPQPRRSEVRPVRRHPRPSSPDDDPEFLRNIRSSRKEDEDMLRRWEEDLRKREDDLRKREGRDDKPDA